MPNFIFPCVARDVDALSCITLDHITLTNLSYLQPWWAASKHTDNFLPQEPVSLGFWASGFPQHLRSFTLLQVSTSLKCRGVNIPGAKGVKGPRDESWWIDASGSNASREKIPSRFYMVIQRVLRETTAVGCLLKHPSQAFLPFLSLLPHSLTCASFVFSRINCLLDLVSGSAFEGTKTKTGSSTATQCPEHCRCPINVIGMSDQKHKTCWSHLATCEPH